MNSTLYREVVAGLRKSALLEEYLGQHTDDELLRTKTAHDVQLFEHVKQASRAARVMESLRNFAGTPMGRGLGYGAGAMVPVTAGGAYLAHRAGEEAKSTSADLRNKALQTALGVGAIGAGLYGLHRLTRPTEQKSVQWARDPNSGEMVPVTVAMSKESASQENADVLLQKLATVGYLDTILEEQEKNADESVRQDARECRMLNAEHGIDLLRQLLP